MSSHDGEGHIVILRATVRVLTKPNAVDGCIYVKPPAP
jgi:hypothetical protein